MANLSNADRLKTLTRQEATVLYWKCYGWRYGKIAEKMGYGEDRITQIMSSVYQKLGFEKEMHWTERTRLLNQIFCKEFMTLIGGQYKNIEDWPLYGKGITEEVRQEEPMPDLAMTALVLYDEKQLTVIPEVVDGEIVRQETQKNGNGRGTCLTRVLGGLGVLVVILGVGAAAYYFGLRQGRQQVPTPVLISSPIPQGVSTMPPQAPVDTATATSAPTDAAVPTLTEVPTIVPPPTNTPFVPPADGILFQDNFDNGLSPDWLQNGANWIIANGKLTLMPDQTDNYKWIQINHPEWKNYTLSVDVINAGYQTQIYGYVVLAVRTGSQSKYIGVEIDNNFYIYWALLGSDMFATEPISGKNYDFSFSPGSNVELTAKDDNYTLSVNGRKVQTITMTGYDSGGISLGMNCSAVRCPSFGNVKVTYLP